MLVMDGMGESYRSMREDLTGLETESGDYMHDLKYFLNFNILSFIVFILFLLRLLRKNPSLPFVGVPTILNPSSGYREAESAYILTHTAGSGSSDDKKERGIGEIVPLFKRWTR